MQQTQQQIVKPKTHSGKKFLENRAPKLIENDKTTIFIRGVNANNVVLQTMKDFAALKRPHCVFFNKKNDIKPMEDVNSLEFFCQRSDASQFMFGSHNKKRPNNLVVGRTFNGRVLDIFELGVEDFKPLKDFKNAKVATGSKPMMLFTEGFDATPEYARLKNFFIDFFRGPVVEYVNLKGLEHLLVFSLINGKVRFRSYKVTLKKQEDSKLPLVELEEIGPHMNLVMRRSQLGSDSLFKQACQKPQQLKHKKVKNVRRDPFGTTQGRIHMERQDYARLQTRKLKGLKKRGSDQVEESAPKKAKVAEESS
ncbi:hypothetical protein JTE90_008613 [Oedothorax gibbosus]|uniref:Ribosome production factor 2 homolog n=1 Tax=Oedothorax gibbosus TaxID=931172 RepID=A0AAV6UE18_9ARAC|nr:hypothetical protein JTE90_008613 [Oedothorax gibbosus]